MWRFLTTALFRLIPMAAGVISAIYADSLFWKITALVCGTIVTLLLDYLQVLLPQRKLEKLTGDLLHKFFGDLSKQALALSPRAILRFNVLVPKRLLRTGFTRHLYVRHPFGMTGALDVNLHFSSRQGVAGYAIRQQKQQVYFEDLRRYSPEEMKKKFHTSDELLQATTHLAAIAVVPLYGKSWRPWVNERLIGVFAADTETDEGVAVLENKNTQESLFHHAQLAEITMGA